MLALRFVLLLAQKLAETKNKTKQKNKIKEGEGKINKKVFYVDTGLKIVERFALPFFPKVSRYINPSRF